MATDFARAFAFSGYVDLKETYSDAHETQHDWVFLAAAYLGLTAASGRQVAQAIKAGGGSEGVVCGRKCAFIQ